MNCESLASYYENQIVQLKKESKKFEQINLELELGNALHSIRKLEEENNRLKIELKSKEIAIKQVSLEKNSVEKELSIVKEQLDSTYKQTSYVRELEKSQDRSRDQDEFLGLKREVENLKMMKDKLEQEIANSEREKVSGFNEAIEEYEERFLSAQKSAEFWKSRAHHLSIKSFTFLRALKMDVFEIKHDSLQFFEDANTLASSVVSTLVKKYKFALNDFEDYLQMLLKKSKKSKRKMYTQNK